MILHISKQNRNTLLFIGLFLLAGGVYMLTRNEIALIDTTAFCLNYTIYICLLFFWILSVYERLLPTRSRTYILFCAGWMLIFLFLRIYRYRIGAGGFWNRFVLYAYNVPMVMITTLFFLIAVRSRQGEEKSGQKAEFLLLLPALLLSTLILTNDLHFLSYRPVDSQFFDTAASYVRGPLFYVQYAYMVVMLLSGLVLLLRTAKNYHKRWIFLILADILLWISIVILSETVLVNKLKPFTTPETHIFGMLGLCEICIRMGLISYNENYSGVFRSMEQPAMITDRQLQPVYRTSVPVTALEAQMREAVQGPVYLDSDTCLKSRPLRSGYVFWTEDEEELRRLNLKLQETGEELAQENELIEAENRLLETQAYVATRNRIYSQISEKMYPAQQRLAALLKDLQPDAPDFKDRITKALVVSAYIKRATNMLIAQPEEAMIPTEELRRALQESASYLQYRGLAMEITSFEKDMIFREDAFRLYTLFEQLMESLDTLPDLMSVSFSGGELRLVTRETDVPPVPGLTIQQGDGLLYLSITAEGGRT